MPANLVFSTTNLRQALETVKPAVSTRSPMPIQACVLLTCERHGDDIKLTVRGSNAVFGVATTVDCDAGSDATIAVNAQQLSDFVNLLETGALIDCYFNNKNNVAEFHSGKHQAKFRTYDASEYPIPPPLKPTHKFNVDAETFFAALKRVSIARLPSKAGLLGECMALDIEDGKLAILSNSTFQLAIANGMDAGKCKDDQYLMPPQTIDYLKSFGGSEGKVNIQFNATALQIIVGDVVVHTVRQRGSMRNTSKILPQNFAAILETDFSDFRRAINVVSVLMQGKEETKTLDVTVADGKMVIRPEAMPDTDTSESEVDCTHTMPIAFKMRAYQVKDFLAVTHADKLQIRTKGISEHSSLTDHLNLYVETAPDFAYWMAAIHSNNAPVPAAVTETDDNASDTEDAEDAE